MDEGLIGKPGLVCIEGVLLILPVDGDQSLVVLAVFTAFGPGIGTEVEHVPHMGCPEVLPGEELLYEFLMVVCLILLGVIPLDGLRGVPVQGLAAVLGAADGTVRILLMELIEPGTVHGGLPAVPAEVVVV